MHLEPDHKYSQEVQNRRNFNLQDKVLKKGAPRASYQDSNIFGTKAQNSETV